MALRFLTPLFNTTFLMLGLSVIGLQAQAEIIPKLTTQHTDIVQDKQPDTAPLPAVLQNERDDNIRALAQNLFPKFDDITPKTLQILKEFCRGRSAATCRARAHRTQIQKLEKITDPKLRTWLMDLIHSRKYRGHHSAWPRYAARYVKQQNLFQGTRRVAVDQYQVVFNRHQNVQSAGNFIYVPITPEPAEYVGYDGLKHTQSISLPIYEFIRPIRR